MSKKKRKNKRKRTTEQVKKQEPASVVDVHPDLKKTALLTAVCLLILFVLYLTQSHWSQIIF